MTERRSNGWEDKPLPEFSGDCWNCHSKRYRQTTATEHCPDCGISCDYWGDGANETYKQASWARQDKEEELQEWREQYREQQELEWRIANGYCVDESE